MRTNGIVSGAGPIHIDVLENLVNEKWALLNQRINAKVFNFVTMYDFAVSASDPNLDRNFTFSLDVFKKTVENLISANKEVDIRVIDNFMGVFKAVFMRVENVEAAMEHVYGLDYFRESEHNVPSFKKSYRSFEAKFQAALSALDAENPRLFSPEFGTLCRQFAFFLTIAPKPVVRTILIHSLEVKASQPTIIEIFRRTPAFFRLSTPVVGAPDRSELVFISLVHRTLRMVWDPLKLDTVEKRDAMADFLVEVTCTNNTVRFEQKANGLPVPIVEISKPPVLSTVALLRMLIKDLLPNSSHPNHAFLISLINRVLALDEAPKRVWHINWKRGDDSEAAETEISDVDVTNELFSLAKAKHEDHKLCALIADAFELLDKKLEADQVPTVPTQKEAIVKFVKDLRKQLQQQGTKQPQKAETAVPQVEVVATVKSGQGMTAESSGQSMSAEKSVPGMTAKKSGQGMTAEKSGQAMTAEKSGQGKERGIVDLPPPKQQHATEHGTTSGNKAGAVASAKSKGFSDIPKVSAETSSTRDRVRDQEIGNDSHSKTSRKFGTYKARKTPQSHPKDSAGAKLPPMNETAKPTPDPTMKPTEAIVQESLRVKDVDAAKALQKLAEGVDAAKAPQKLAEGVDAEVEMLQNLAEAVEAQVPENLVEDVEAEVRATLEKVLFEVGHDLDGTVPMEENGEVKAADVEPVVNVKKVPTPKRSATAHRFMRQQDTAKDSAATGVAAAGSADQSPQVDSKSEEQQLQDKTSAPAPRAISSASNGTPPGGNSAPATSAGGFGNSRRQAPTTAMAFGRGNLSHSSSNETPSAQSARRPPDSAENAPSQPKYSKYNQQPRFENSTRGFGRSSQSYGGGGGGEGNTGFGGSFRGSDFNKRGGREYSSGGGGNYSHGGRGPGFHSSDSGGVSGLRRGASFGGGTYRSHPEPPPQPQQPYRSEQWGEYTRGGGGTRPSWRRDTYKRN